MSFEDQVALLLDGATVEEAAALASGDTKPRDDQALVTRYLRLGWDTAAATEARQDTLDAVSDPFEGLTAKAAS